MKTPETCMEFDQTDLIPDKCECGAAPFLTFMRGQVVRPSRLWYWPFKCRPTYAVICADCKEIVGWEWVRVIDITGDKHLSKRDARLALQRRGRQR